MKARTFFARTTCPEPNAPRLITACARSLTALLVLMLSAQVQAQFSYWTQDDTVMILAYTDSGGAVTVPETIDGLPVTRLGDNSFTGAIAVTNVTIPDSVTSIGRWAFASCSNLTAIVLGNGVTSIEDHAFYQCSSLISVAIPDGVSNIQTGTFQYCTSLTSVAIPSSVTSIGDSAFYYCVSLTGVTIPGTVTSIGPGAFYWCTSLSNATIPNSVSNIGRGAFYNCDRLTTVAIGNSITSIGDDAFASCTNLGSVAIPGRVTSIGSNAFFRCSNLTNITLPGSVTSIGDSAFAACTNLATMVIPDSVNNLGNSVFENCSHLARVTIGSGITSVGGEAFYGCTSLTNVDIPDSVTSIWDDAFDGCTNMTSVTIGNSVAWIGPYAFAGCTSLTSVTIPNSVTSIGNDAFDGCTNMTSVTIGNSVTSIGYNAFNNCTSLTSVFFMGNAPSNNTDRSVFANDAKATAYYLPGTTGWGIVAFDGIPTALWSASQTPSIAEQPQSVTTHGLATVSFSVLASGRIPLSYQWSLNGTNVQKATSSTLTITRVTQSDLGVYSVVVTNAYGTITSSNALLSMYPFIDVPFAGVVTNWGENATLSVQAWGTGPLSYQWLLNGAAIPTATNETLSLTSIQFTNAGLYSVVVSSPLGSVTNTPAQVVVNLAGVSLGLYPGVTVAGVVGYTYIIQSNPDLTNTNGWATVETLTLTQPEQLWVDVNVNAAPPTNAHRFYRVFPGP
jgi:hypothetical protein